MHDAPVPEKLSALKIVMETGRTIAWLKSLNVRAVTLANNHTLDLGLAARTQIQQALRQAGIEALAFRRISSGGVE